MSSGQDYQYERKRSSHPLTSVPLALSTKDNDSRQGSKAVLRNHIVSETDAVNEEAPIRTEWVIDGMAAVQSVSPKTTCGEYADSSSTLHAAKDVES